MMQIDLPVHGKSYDAKKDKKRIDSVRHKVWAFMIRSGGFWSSVHMIRKWSEVGDSCDVTRRLREMRDIGYVIEKKRGVKPGIWLYRAVKVKK